MAQGSVEINPGTPCFKKPRWYLPNMSAFLVVFFHMCLGLECSYKQRQQMIYRTAREGSTQEKCEQDYPSVFSVALIAHLAEDSSWMQEVSGSNPRLGGSGVSAFQASGGIGTRHPAIKGLRPPEHHAGHSIRNKQIPLSQTNILCGCGTAMRAASLLWWSPTEHAPPVCIVETRI